MTMYNHFKITYLKNDRVLKYSSLTYGFEVHFSRETEQDFNDIGWAYQTMNSRVK
jgi:hypothetical protein